MKYLGIQGKSDRCLEHAGRKGDDAGAETTVRLARAVVVLVVTSRQLRPKAKCQLG